MLKGRSKKFAPKAAIRRPVPTPASTQSSQRPSVEPQSSVELQSQTPVLDKHTQDAPFPVSQAAPVLPAVEFTPQPALSQPAVENDNSATEESSRQSTPQPKRKAHGEIAAEPPAKRVALFDMQATTAENSRAWSANQESIENEAPQPRTRRPTPPPTEPTESRPQSSPPSLRSDVEQLQTPQSSARATPQQNGPLPPYNVVNLPFGRVDNFSNDNDSEHGPPSPRGHSSPSRHKYPPPPDAEEKSFAVTSDPGLSAANGSLGAAGGGLGAAGEALGIARPGSSDLGGAGGSGVLMEPGSHHVPSIMLDPLDGANIHVSDSATSGDEGWNRKKKIYKNKKGVRDTKSKLKLAQGKTNPRGTSNLTVSKKDKVAKKPKKKREETPDNASDLEIDVHAKTMADLCEDQKRGRKSINLATVRQNMTKQKETRKKQLQIYYDMIEEGEEPLAKKKEEQAGPPVEIQTQGAQMRVVNGAIVLDNESMQVNQHRNSGDDIQEIVEENDFTHLITSNSFRKDPKILRDFRKTQTWDEAATEMFYQGLRTWGTDFETIATMFPHRNRRSIKLKFNREEKLNGAKVTRALLGPRGPVNLEEQLAELQTLGRIELDEVIDIEAVQIADKLEFDEKQAQRAKELEDERLRKIEEINKNKEAGRRMLDSGEESESDEGRRGKGKKKKKTGPKKKRNRQSTAPEETMEVLHSIEID